jgi:hypothetical protein
MERMSVASALPSLFSLVALASRRGETEAAWAALVQRSGRPMPEILCDFGFLTRLGPELLGFYLLLWELVSMSERE